MAHTPYLFSQFFDYASRDFPIEDFDEFFMLAKEEGEYWDMLAGAIYHCNPAACLFLLEKHDYKQYVDNKLFMELIDQCLHQSTCTEEIEDSIRISSLIKQTGLVM